MRTLLRRAAYALGCWSAAVSLTSAQTLDVSSSAGRRIVDGAVGGARAGASLAVGDLTGDFWEKELIIGAPDESGARGAVRVFISRPQAAQSTTAAANVVLTGGAAGDRFGTAVDAGYVTQQEVVLDKGTPVGDTPPRDLVVGAPGAQGGRGVVYVFAGPFASGTTRTPANAAFTIIGAVAGDNLGSVIESADLNGDRYREVILAVPSRGLIYVIDLRSVPTTTVDLAVRAPAMLMSGVGGEIALATGDINGDDIFDLAVGDPTWQINRGIVYLVLGRVGALPATLSLPTQANAQLAGGEPHDWFGIALWMADVDTFRDFAAELIVGAPGGDGPANARVDAGEVTIIWGRPNITAAFTPGPTLFGAASGHRLGRKLAAGDITRDSPDDIVMLAPGANGGSGEAFVYFGMDRSIFPAGPIDMAVSGNRRVISDETVGAIETARVWEITGEGAEDIVLGVPTATTSAGALAGRLYVALSPRFEPSPTSLSIRAMQGSTDTAPLTVGNPSAFPISFNITSTAAWVRATPSPASAVVGAPAGLTVTANARGLAAGQHTATINLVSISRDLRMTLAVPVTLKVLPQPTITASIPGSVQIGQSVTWTVNADMSEGAVEYMFRRYTTAGGWVTVRAYGTSNTYSWTPGSADVGQYVIEVWVRRVGSTEPFETQTNTGYFAVGNAAPIVVLTHNTDFDGDGRADPSIFRPSNGMWFALLSGTQFATSASRAWGIGTDIPVPGDYDGDRRTDYAVFRPSSGTWFVLLSSSAYATSIARPWGMATDRPVPADYDGDGRTDYAVFRPSTGMWFILESSTGNATSRSVVWGARNDRLAPADYDRDGRADPAVFRPANGTWYVLESSTSYSTSVARVWGAGSDLPVAADYDGDGRADFAVFRPSNGTWFVLQSSTGFTTSLARAWGAATDLPVAADYNGDRIVDMAVFRPAASSTWFVWNQFTRAWGTIGDFPLLVR